jgi:hypothetical protein
MIDMKIGRHRLSMEFTEAAAALSTLVPFVLFCIVIYIVSRLFIVDSNES